MEDSFTLITRQGVILKLPNGLEMATLFGPGSSHKGEITGMEPMWSSDTTDVSVRNAAGQYVTRLVFPDAEADVIQAVNMEQWLDLLEQCRKWE